MIRPAFRPPATAVVVATVVAVCAPIVVAVAVLAGRHWQPGLDNSLIGLRVRDVFSGDPPLIGLTGRLSSSAVSGSHLGPLAFYVLAPVYALFGGSGWALEVASAAVQLVACGLGLWIGWRRGGQLGVVCVGAVLALALHTIGPIASTHPWIPYLPVLAWIVVMLATWSVWCGDSALLSVVVVAASFCAQTHVSFAVVGGGLTLSAFVMARRATRAVVTASLIGVVLWIPPIIDQIVNRPGNFRVVFGHFLDPDEASLGLADGLRLALARLDLWEIAQGDVAVVTESIGSPWRGAALAMGWVAIAGLAWRRCPSALRRLHSVLGLAAALGALSLTGIIGPAWNYLTLFAWATSCMIVGAAAWSIAVLCGRACRFVAATMATLAIAVLAISSVVTFAGGDVPEPRISATVHALSDPTYDAIVDGVGAAVGLDGVYQIAVHDAVDIGGVAMGLFLDLEDRGLDVSLPLQYRAMVGSHRVRDVERGGVDAEVVVATGSWVEAWRSSPDALEVASFDPRTPLERLQFSAARRSVLAVLEARGFDDLAALVDDNLFALVVSPDLPDDVADDVATLFRLGASTSVFIVPLGAAPPSPR